MIKRTRYEDSVAGAKVAVEREEPNLFYPSLFVPIVYVEISNLRMPLGDWEELRDKVGELLTHYPDRLSP